MNSTEGVLKIALKLKSNPNWEGAGNGPIMQLRGSISTPIFATMGPKDDYLSLVKLKAIWIIPQYPQ